MAVLAAACLTAGVARAQDKPAAEAKPQDLNQAPAGFVALFNGKDLEGWVGRPQVDPVAFLRTYSPAAVTQPRGSTGCSLTLARSE